ncbi:hypothetical protein FSP39_024457 [Pinctada imbricata]|uniref:WD repeat-containing protein 74 n=1 Tax=Pinctada imbricata TaxID=66713 RepID=A0AA88YPV6_PINIB|nr:hypothetical protein FSP39_024457 [Pinctada imbricata]
MAAPICNVYVGAETGLLKGIHVQKSNWTNLNSVENADKSKEIVSLSWSDDSETELCVGLKNQTALLCNLTGSQNTNEISFDAGEGKLRNVVKINDKYFTSVEAGSVKCWQGDDVIAQWNAGKDLFVHRHNPKDTTQFVTGGKENELKLWDVERELTPIFTTKNVRNDWLNLRVPVWVTGVVFCRDSDRLISCTGHHQIRVYDPKVQRRPVLDFEFDEYPITALCLHSSDDNLVVVGNTHGKMGTIDVRTGKVVNLFKGFAGGIRDIQCHASEPIVASCGLDRYLRVHDLNTRALLHKFYLKSRLNCIVLSKNWELKNIEDDDCKLIGGNVTVKNELTSDGEDDVWDQLKTVSTKTKRKHQTEDLAEKKRSKIQRKETDKKVSDSESKTSKKQKQTKKKKINS